MLLPTPCGTCGEQVAGPRPRGLGLALSQEGGADAGVTRALLGRREPGWLRVSSGLGSDGAVGINTLDSLPPRVSGRLCSFTIGQCSRSLWR